jgi:hypothetical protein
MPTSNPYRTTKAAQRAAMITDGTDPHSRNADRIHHKRMTTPAKTTPGTTHTTRFTEMMVRGRTWEGFTTTYTYHLRPDQPTPATLAEAKRYAPDFETLTSAEIITATTTISTSTKEITR